MQRISSGSVWEKKLGYSRATVAGGLVFVSATAATDTNGMVIGKCIAFQQVKSVHVRLDTLSVKNELKIVPDNLAVKCERPGVYPAGLSLVNIC